MSIAAILAGLISGVLGGMGLGGGGTLILYLTIFAGVEQYRAQGINLMFFIPSAIVAILIYFKRGSIRLKPLVPFILGGIPGALLGIYFSSVFGEGLLQKIFGIALILMGIRELFYGSREKN